MQATQKCVQRIINSVWTLEYRNVDDSSIEIVRYSREDDEGYAREHELDNGHPIEDAGRTVVGAHINGKDFTVTNPKHVFSYGA